MTVKISWLGAIYGSLTASVTFLMRLFFSSGIFLIGAELVRNLGNTEKTRRFKTVCPRVAMRSDR